MSEAAADGGQGGPLVFLVVGEPSGDQLGAKLMSALKAGTGGRVCFAGVGGERMVAEGLDSLVPIDELAVLGLIEVLPHVLGILRRIRQVANAAKAARPAVVVTIDSPDFTLRVSRRLAGLGIPLVHYVAPSVWAWKPWRAARIARYLDHLLVLLPFEPPYFEPHGLAVTFVGHPAVEAACGGREPTRFRRDHGIPDEAPLVCVLPGSRAGEVRRLEPAFAGALGLLAARFPGLRAVVPTVPTVAGLVEAAVERWPVPATVLREAAAKYEAFAAADAALAASGTVAVELAVAGVPAVIAYKVAPLTAFIGRRVAKVAHVSIPNILLGREAQPELLQEHCTAEKLAGALGRLLSDPAARDAQIEACHEATRMLDPGGEGPSQRAARAVLDLIQR
ncbi:MAG: lipid-A-disaccharide synthase [Alphaproteobacteria bacterium]